MRVRSAVRSDRGRRRRVNEDACGAAVGPAGGQLFCVCDGMGGHQAGDVASRVAVGAATSSWQSQPLDKGTSWALAHCVVQANEAVLREAQGRGLLGDMGSTIALLALDDTTGFIAHAGDSRVYLIRGERIQRMTTDHTEAAERVAAGLLDPAAADRSKYTHILTRGLGLDDPVVPDVSGPIPLRQNDTFLVCSDGLSGTVDDATIGAIIRYHAIEEACDHLVHLANKRGGPDNITVQLVRVGDHDGPLEVPPPGYQLDDRSARWPLWVAFAVIAIAVAITAWLALG